MTAQEIAQKAGVFRGTVDRALHGRGGVNPETAERIRRIAREAGYTPSRAGRALVSREPVPIGVILSSRGNPFFDDVRQGMLDAREDYADFPVELRFRALRGYRETEQLTALRTLTDGDVRGVALTPVNSPAVAEAIGRLAARDVPVVTVNTDVEGSARRLYVGCDDDAAGRTAGKLMGLLTGGAGHALVVVGSRAVLGHMKRLRGFSEAAGLEYPRLTVATVENGDDDDESFRAVKEALAAHPDIDCVYFAAAGAVGGVKACRGRVAPDRIILSDDIAAHRELILQGSAAAAICQQPRQQGYRAMKALLREVLIGQRPETDTLFTRSEIKLRYNL